MFCHKHAIAQRFCKDCALDQERQELMNLCKHQINFGNQKGFEEAYTQLKSFDTKHQIVCTGFQSN